MKRFMGLFYLFLAFTLAGTSVISARIVSGKLGVFSITAASLFFTILCLAPLCRNKLIETARLMSITDWLISLLQALCGIFLFRMFLLLGLLHTSTGEAGILTGATPAATAFLAWLVLKEPIRNNLTGIFCTLGGFLLIQGGLQPGSQFQLEHFWGNILVLCSALSESLFNILSRLSNLRAPSFSRQPFDPIVQTTMVSCMAFLLCLPPALFEHPVHSLMSIGPKEWLALAWYGLVVTALAFIFWYAGIERSTASSAAAFSGMMPFTGLILSVILLGEHVRWQQWSGGALIILGMLFIGLNQAKIASSEQSKNLS